MILELLSTLVKAVIMGIGFGVGSKLTDVWATKLNNTNSSE